MPKIELLIISFCWVLTGFSVDMVTILSVFISLVTSHYTNISNKVLSEKGVYGVPAGSYSIDELGALITLNYSNILAKNITYKGRVDLFSNYQSHPNKVDVFMPNQFSFKINRFFWQPIVLT